jgi:hypothetical protein
MPALHSTAGSGSTDADTRTTAASTAASRRRFLGTAGAVLAGALAGCSAAATPGETGRTNRSLLVDTTVRVDPGQAAARRFTLDGERWVAVAATLSDRSVKVKQDGPAVDVVTMTPAQYERYRDGEGFAHLPGVSMPDVVNGEVASTLGAGEYVLVVDNTTTGPGEPAANGVPAVVDLTVTATPERERATVGGRPVGE